MPTQYGVFSDESSHKASRFSAIAAVSLPANLVTVTNKELQSILDDSGVSEFKWTKVRGARDRICAQKLIDYVVDRLIRCDGRVDVLIWDTQDHRHRVFGRDDVKNFERMYFHLHKNLMIRREHDAVWHLRPDEQVGIDWSTAKDCLQSVGRWKTYCATLFPDDPTWKHLYKVESLEEVNSCEYPLCQLADLFAGVAPYTRSRSDIILHLMDKESGQVPLFEIDGSPEPSKSDEERYPVVEHLGNRCRELKLGVSLRTSGYFKTHDPTMPVNFWHYVPQHPEDRAPTRDD